MIKDSFDKAMETGRDIVENDKTLVIFVLMVYGVLALAMRFDGAMDLVEKLSAGLLGMAIGRAIK